MYKHIFTVSTIRRNFETEIFKRLCSRDSILQSESNLSSRVSSALHRQRCETLSFLVDLFNVTMTHE